MAASEATIQRFIASKRCWYCDAHAEKMTYDAEQTQSVPVCERCGLTGKRFSQYTIISEPFKATLASGEETVVVTLRKADGTETAMRLANVLKHSLS